MNKETKLGIVSSIAGLVLIAFGVSGWTTVDAGHRGVVTRMGRVTGEILGEGFALKLPIVTRIVEMDVRQQKEQVSTEGASKDIQTVKAVVALNLSILPDKCATLYQSIGVRYLDTAVAPIIQESIKAILAQYTAEELITKRETVRTGITDLIASRILPLGLRADALNIVDFDFSTAFNAAIEAKVTAEQNALASKNLLAQKEYEAQQAVATAKGKAEAMQIESAALMKNPQVLQLRALEKWDGALPKVAGSTIPFIDVKPFTN